MDSKGNMITKGKHLTRGTNLSAFEKGIFSIIDEHELNDIHGIAISCPGTIDVDTGMIYHGW